MLFEPPPVDIMTKSSRISLPGKVVAKQSAYRPLSRPAPRKSVHTLPTTQSSWTLWDPAKLRVNLEVETKPIKPEIQVVDTTSIPEDSEQSGNYDH